MPERTSLTIADAELTDLRAITIRQPYAQLVALGAKTIETRGRRTKHRGPIAIHAAAAWTVEQFVELVQAGNGPAIADALGAGGHVEPHTERRTKGPYPGGVYFASWELVHDLPLGAIVAVADLVDCLPIVDAVPIGEHDRDETVLQLLANDGAGRTRLDVLRREVQGGVIERNVDDQLPLGIYTPGRYGLLLENVVRLPEPVPCKGQQAVPWRVPEDVAAKVREYVEEAGQ